MRLYFKYLSILLRSQMQYRLSFFITAIGQFFLTFSYFISVFLLFERFGSLGEWSLWEVALCTGVVQTVFPITECIARGFDGFSGLVVSGSFDRLLTRPRSLFLQIFGSRFELNRVGRLMQGLFVLILAAVKVDIVWTPDKVLLLLLMVLSGVVIFTGVFIMGATLCFWTVQGLEVVNILTDGGREISQYPLGIYKVGFLRFFTFVIPYAAMNYYPLLYLTGRAGGHAALYYVAPLLGMLFIVPAMLIFRWGVRHYLSTGS